MVPRQERKRKEDTVKQIGNFLRIAIAVAPFFFAGAAAAQQVQVMDAITEVIETTSRLGYSLDQFSHAVAGNTAVCSVQPGAALDQAEDEADLLADQISDLDSLMSSATAQEEYLAEQAILEGKARIEALGDALAWAPPGGGGGVVPKVTWCGGWVNCIILKHACEGCFKCYVGLTDCGCFVPCP